MATYYADFDLATGNNTGVDQANAWKTMNDAIAGSNGTIPAAGDTVLCRGTDTLGATCTNALSGNDTTGGFIKWIGVDASWNNVGGTTRAILNGNGGSYHVLTQSGAYNLYENFGFTGSGNGDGVVGTGDTNVYYNCAFYSNNQQGYDGNGMTQIHLIRCTFYSNGTQGCAVGNYCRVLFCSAHDNGTDGFGDANGRWTDYIGCLSYHNGDRGWESVIYGGMLFGCVSDKNVGDSLLVYSQDTNLVFSIIGCRFTNAPSAKYGIDFNTNAVVWGWNYLGGNDTDTVDSTIAYELLHNGTATNTVAGTDTNHGYTVVGDGVEDYNLRSDATIRRTAILIPTS